MGNDFDDDDKKHSEKVDKVWGRAKSQAREALDWSRRISKVGKLKLDSTRLQRMRQALYQELGQKTYELLKENRFDPTALYELVNQIDDLTQKIDTQNLEINTTARRSTP